MQETNRHIGLQTLLSAWQSLEFDRQPSQAPELFTGGSLDLHKTKTKDRTESFNRFISPIHDIHGPRLVNYWALVQREPQTYFFMYLYNIVYVKNVNLRNLNSVYSLDYINYKAANCAPWLPVKLIGSCMTVWQIFILNRIALAYCNAESESSSCLYLRRTQNQSQRTRVPVRIC